MWPLLLSEQYGRMLLDIGLPRLNGYDVCRHLREQPWAAQMAIVAVTGWGQENDRERARAAGFKAHLVKPLEYPKLEELITESAPRHPA
ncbi:MAG TPA: response regulator [Gemmatimonadales bacterium]|nr:response regulator [Gemmatimonadales bacterium]